MQLCLIGHGYVGSAVEHAMKASGHSVAISDPAKNGVNISAELLRGAFATYVCVPTPTTETGHCDTSVVETVLEELNTIGTRAIVVIKSTVPPDRISTYEGMYPCITMVYEPEFLTQANANADIMFPSMRILGGKPKNTELLRHFYMYATNIETCECFQTDMVSASITKYAINSYLASKVSFMNMMYDIHSKSDTTVPFADISRMMEGDIRIGNSHTDVPGPDGQFGFGGACFPKDVRALIAYANDIGASAEMLKTVQEENVIHRLKLS